MNKIIQSYGLQPADRIVVPKSSLNFVQHHAIYWGRDQYGIDWIIENKERFGVRFLTAAQFFADNPYITRLEKFNGSNYARQLATQLASSKVGRPYNLLNYNCEHFANEVQFGITKSAQINIGVFGVAMVALIFLAAKK